MGSSSPTQQPPLPPPQSLHLRAVEKTPPNGRWLGARGWAGPSRWSFPTTAMLGMEVMGGWVGVSPRVSPNHKDVLVPRTPPSPPPQEVVSQCRKLTRKNREQLSELMCLDKQKGLKSLSKEKRQKLEAYQHLFYLLQVGGVPIPPHSPPFPSTLRRWS